MNPLAGLAKVIVVTFFLFILPLLLTGHLKGFQGVIMTLVIGMPLWCVLLIVKEFKEPNQ